MQCPKDGTELRHTSKHRKPFYNYYQSECSACGAVYTSKEYFTATLDAIAMDADRISDTLNPRHKT